MRHKFLLFALCVSVLLAACSDDDTQIPPVVNPDEQTDPEVPDKPVEPEFDFGIDLSEQGTANSYVINKSGVYSFDARKMGNGVSVQGINAEELDPKAAKLLWQDHQDLITDVELKDGRMVFNVSAIDGNAVVAVTDDADKVLWSWHLWVTPYNPYKELDKRKFNGVSWMDRNLGALTADWDLDGRVKGLVYQWGRKDPFPTLEGWEDQNLEMPVYNASSERVEIEQMVVDQPNNLANAIANPMIYYSGVRNNSGQGPYDWYTTTDYSAQHNGLWETADRQKTMFDPCPPGWRVPKTEAWAHLNNNSLPLEEQRVSGRLHEVIGYLPFCGVRGFEGGVWAGVNNLGDYWSSTAVEEGLVRTLHMLPSYVNSRGANYRAAGMPVRCVSEKEDPRPDNPDDEFDLTIVAEHCVEASYIKSQGADGSANYYIGLSDSPVVIDDQTGQMVPEGIGSILYMDIYAKNSEDSDNAILPEGTYVVNSTTMAGVANTDFTWVRYRDREQAEVKYHLFNTGEIVVKHTKNGYSIVGKFESTEHVMIQVKYEGQIELVNRGQTEIQTTISNPVDVTFTCVDAVYEHTNTSKENPYDRYSVNLWVGELDETGYQMADGYVVHLDLQSEPLSTHENMQIKEGVYQVSDDYGAGRVLTGALYNLMGVPMYVGSYCQETRPDNEAVLYGFATKGGTVEVKRDANNNYEFIVDFVTPEQVHIKGVYPMAPVNFIDNSPQMPGGDWNSILHEDKAMVFSETDDVYAYGYNYGAAYFEATSHFELFVSNHTTNESFYLAFLAPEGQKSPAGTYVVSKNPEAAVAGEFLPGYMNLSTYADTWCYIFFEGQYEAGGAPATEGTLTITEVEGQPEIYHIEYEMYDDATPKNKVTAMWTGKLNITYY